MLELQDVLRVLSGVKRVRNGYIAQCPAHSDRTPSLSIRETDDGKVLLYCHAGCDYRDVRNAIWERM